MEKRRASQVMLLAKNLPVNAGDKTHEFNPWVRKNPLGRAWQPSLVNREVWRATVHGISESDTTEHLST